MREPGLEAIGVREDAVRFRAVDHVLLDAEVVDAQIEMQRRGHAHRREVRGAVTTGAHMEELGQVGESALGTW